MEHQDLLKKWMLSAQSSTTSTFRPKTPMASNKLPLIQKEEDYHQLIEGNLLIM